MRVVVARCSATYEGRLASTLDEAVRLVMVKADGCVAIHADGGAYKPLNWMNAPNVLVEEDDMWTVTNKAGERLEIRFAEVLHETSWELDLTSGLVLDGVERELQELLAEHPEVIEPGLICQEREYRTPIGPVDLRCTDTEGVEVLVEIKRIGEISGVEQISRYLEVHADDADALPRRGILVATDIKPQAKELARTRGIDVAVVDLAALRGFEQAQTQLFVI